jgi:hypothetical protein
VGDAHGVAEEVAERICAERRDAVPRRREPELCSDHAISSVGNDAWENEHLRSCEPEVAEPLAAL